MIIKFRAWDKNKLKMLEVVQIDFNTGYSADLCSVKQIQCSDDGWEDVPNFVLLQYVGLKDSKGCEIYEGDILKSCDEPIDENADICVVKYKGSGFWAFEPKFNDFNGDIAGWINYDTEIIGNIYENQELINEKP